MSETQTKPKTLITPPGRLSFPSLWKPSSFENSEPKFECTLLFPPEANLKALEDQVDAAAKKKWPKGLPKAFVHPIKDVEDKTRDDGTRPVGYEKDGWRFARFWRKTAQRIVHNEREEDGTFKEISEESGLVYAGCWVVVSYNCFAYEAKGNKGCSFGLQNVQFFKDDEAFLAGRSDPNDDFGDLEDALS